MSVTCVTYKPGGRWDAEERGLRRAVPRFIGGLTQVSGIRYQVSGIRYQVSGIRYSLINIALICATIRANLRPDNSPFTIHNSQFTIHNYLSITLFRLNSTKPSFSICLRRRETTTRAVPSSVLICSWVMYITLLPVRPDFFCR